MALRAGITLHITLEVPLGNPRDRELRSALNNTLYGETRVVKGKYDASMLVRFILHICRAVDGACRRHPRLSNGFFSKCVKIVRMKRARAMRCAAVYTYIIAINDVYWTLRPSQCFRNYVRCRI